MSDPKPPDDFDLLHNFAHDLKSPLSALKGYIELVEASGELNDRQLQFNHRAQQALAKIQNTVSELLTFARAEQRLELRTEVCDLQEIVDDNLNTLGILAQEQHIKIETDIASTEQFVYGDYRALDKVFANLISNAIKYNRVGGSIRISTEDRGDWIEVHISDTGLGIPEKDLPRIFEKFYRAKQNTDHQIEGTGLGLSFVQMIIDRHGGTISAESEVEQGTTFSFTLPRAVVSSDDFDRERDDDVDDRDQESREEHKDSDSGIIY